MSDSKKHNSILFLTTLSVYLGLVLVGGANSPVLAQAALTRNFDIREEIEYKDDLDKKPDDELLVSSIIGIVNDLNDFSKQGIFDWNKSVTYQIEGLNFDKRNDSPWFSFLVRSDYDFENKIFKSLNKYVVALAEQVFTKESDLGLGYFHSHNLDFCLASENNSLNLNFKITNGNGTPANVFADPLINYFTQAALKTHSTTEKIVAENTKVTFENNQVFIITNLPRASIDSLLAKPDAT